MALTDVAIRNAKPGSKPLKLADGGGLHLLGTPTGGKLWRLKYRIDGKEKQLAIGAYASAPAPRSAARNTPFIHIDGCSPFVSAWDVPEGGFAPVKTG